MTQHHSLHNSLKKFHLTPKQQVFLLLCNYIQIVHLLGTAYLLFMPWAEVIKRVFWAMFVLYILPPVIARITLALFPIKKRCITIGSRDYFTWWFLLNLQMVFCRFPFLDEFLRIFPTLYSGWLRLWGAKIGKHTYWAAGLHILDRTFLEIGDGVIFGAGVRINPHVIADNREGVPELLLAPVKIGDQALIGGYSLLTAGTVIAPGETTRAFLISPPFSSWKDGKRVGKGDS